MITKMNDFTFNDKHVFFISDRDKFFYLHADALINKSEVKVENICAIVYSTCKGGVANLNELKKLEGVTYFEYEENYVEFISTAKNLTFMSLHECNSGIAKKIIDSNEDVLNRLYLFLTDDEVDRWNKTYLKYNKLTVNKRRYISSDDVYVLKKIKNFIASKETFEEKLKLILNREDINVVDSSLIFDILPTQISKELEQVVHSSNVWSKSEKKILIGSKPRAFSIRQIINIISSCCKAELYNEFSFLLLWPAKKGVRRIIIDLYLLYLRYFKKITVNLSYVTALSPLAYNTLVSSCSHFILQNRGGVSTARLYLKWGQGVVCIDESAENVDMFIDAMNLDVITFASFNELAYKIKQCEIDVARNAELIIKEEHRSARVLAKVYS